MLDRSISGFLGLAVDINIMKEHGWEHGFAFNGDPLGIGMDGRKINYLVRYGTISPSLLAENQPKQSRKPVTQRKTD